MNDSIVVPGGKAYELEMGAAAKKVPEAKLVVEPNQGRLEAYFPGPDLRHNGTFWRMGAKNMASYIAALQDAWSRLEALERVAPAGADLSACAEMNIRVTVRGYPAGNNAPRLSWTDFNARETGRAAT